MKSNFFIPAIYLGIGMMIVIGLVDAGILIPPHELKNYACIQKPDICVEINTDNMGAVLNMLYQAMPNSGGEITFETK